MFRKAHIWLSLSQFLKDVDETNLVSVNAYDISMFPAVKLL